MMQYERAFIVMSGPCLILQATHFELLDNSVSLNTVHDLIDILIRILAITNGVTFYTRCFLECLIES